MQCGSCFKFFSFPASDNAPDEHYQFCPSCRRPSEYDYAYTSRDYEHSHLTEQFYVGEKDDY